MSTKFLLLFIVFFAIVGRAQQAHIDTLKADDAMGGPLEDLDRSAQRFSYPYLYFLQEPARSLPFSLLSPTRRYGYTANNDFNMTFCALPHIGFSYLFGQQGVQQTKAEYQQKIAPNWLLNGRVDNNQFSGFQRNSAFQDLNYSALVKYEDSLIRSIVFIKSSKRFNEWNGGLEYDSLLDVLPQELISVNKEDAQSESKKMYYGQQSKISLNQRKNYKFHLCFENTLMKQNYTYKETGNIASLYAAVYRDSLKTADTLQHLENSNSLSVALQTNDMLLEVGLKHHYLYSEAFEQNLDTNTVQNFVRFHLDQGNLTFDNHSFLTLLGDFTSWQTENKASYQTTHWEGSVLGTIAQLPLGFNQRFYNGNTLRYRYSNSTLQNERSISVQASYKLSKWKFSVAYEFLSLGGLYQFDGQAWSNAALTRFKGQSFRMNAYYRSKGILFESLYAFTLQDEALKYLPNHDFYTRIAFPWGLFKNKVLKSIWGIDLHYLSAHKRLAYCPIPSTVDVLQMSSAILQPGFYKLSAFANFNVNHFRFYARWDNIPSFWIDPSIEIVSGIYYPASQIKIGITWDFWN